MRVRDHLRPEFVAEFEAWAGNAAELVLNEPYPIALVVADILRPGREVLFYGAPLYAITRVLQPRVAVETGICSGCSTRAILAAMDANGTGELWSIDREPLQPYYYASHDTLVNAVGVEAAKLANIDNPRWHPVIKDVLTELPALLVQVGPIDLCWRDTGSWPDRLAFELRHAVSRARPGAVIAHHDDFDQWDRSVLGGARQIFGVNEPRCHLDEHARFHNVLRGWEV